MSCKEKRCSLEKWTISLVLVGSILAMANAFLMYHSHGLFWSIFATTPLLVLSISSIYDLVELHSKRKRRNNG